MLIEVEGERFSITTRVQHDGQRAYDFSWLNGPCEASYGFTIGKMSRPQGIPGELSRSELEEEARLFVRAFFAPDGIGPSDFPDFVASHQENARDS